MKKINEDIIIEEYQASAWGRLSIREGLNIGNALLKNEINDKAYIFAKDKRTETIKGLRVFKEGWRVTHDAPSFYMCIGLSQESRNVGDYMPTLLSVSGQPKEKFDLSVKAWTGWHIFTCLFNPNNFIVSQNNMLVKDRELLKEELLGWEYLLSPLQGNPMGFVLQHYYSHSELERIKSSTSEQLNLWLSELRTYATEIKGDIDTNIHQPLLAKGLFGNAKTINSRRCMRVKFWEQWNINRTDLFDFARQFTTI
jgi:hypothetical protein